MTQVLYNLRTSDLGYRITKFIDGEVESSYLTSDQACNCPAGHRATCRHRQMLPQMLAHNLADSQWFWNHDKQMATNFDGHQVALYETLACAPAEQDTEPSAHLLLHETPEGPIYMNTTTGEPVLVSTGQHTAAESLPPEETVQKPYGISPFILEGGLDAIKADNERMNAKIIAHERANPWRRL